MLDPLYELAVLGSPSDVQLAELAKCIDETVLPFGLRLGQEIAWVVRPGSFTPHQQRAAAAVFFGGRDAPIDNVAFLLAKEIPVLPVVSGEAKVREEIPELLRPFNCLDYSSAGAARIATAMLECIGLLPKQRRVFLSYRRDEARQSALQLFDAFSARRFDVFLDTHGIAPAEDFQAVLWHRLCESDVLVMLDTPNYFASRWTSAEFGRALAKGIAVLQVSWPGATPSIRTQTASRVSLRADEWNAASGQLSEPAIVRICMQLETVRSQSLSVRGLNLVSGLRSAIERIGGSVAGVGPHRAVYVKLPDGTDVVAYPTVGVPNSTTLHEATDNGAGRSVAVVFDHVGLHPTWMGHLDWLGKYVTTARWVKLSEAAWQFADWTVGR